MSVYVLNVNIYLMAPCIATSWTLCYRGFPLTDVTLSGSVVIHHSSPPAVRHCTQSEHVISPLWVLDAGDTVIEPHTESNRATNPPILNHVFTFPSPAVSHPSMPMAHHMHLLVSTVATVWESCPPSRSSHYAGHKGIVNSKNIILSSFTVLTLMLFQWPVFNTGLFFF